MSLWLLLFIACPDHEIALTPSYTEQHSIIESLVTQILTLKRSEIFLKHLFLKKNKLYFCRKEKHNFPSDEKRPDHRTF
jgi:hypothetical protein